MNEIRESIRDIVPKRLLRRPIDHRGYPVPWFVTVKDDEGKWDFRPVETARVHKALKFNHCWICGETLGAHLAFAVGPMCGVNRVSGEPPQHLECAEFAVKACPFMLLPMAKRRTANLPEGVKDNPGGLKRNPGVCLVWSTKSFKPVRTGPQTHVFRMGAPTAISFWTEGRTATRAEIDESVSGGLPTLENMAREESPAALEEFNRMLGVFTELLPA